MKNVEVTAEMLKIKFNRYDNPYRSEELYLIEFSDEGEKITSFEAILERGWSAGYSDEEIERLTRRYRIRQILKEGKIMEDGERNTFGANNKYYYETVKINGKNICINLCEYEIEKLVEALK